MYWSIWTVNVEPIYIYDEIKILNKGIGVERPQKKIAFTQCYNLYFDRVR